VFEFLPEILNLDGDWQGHILPLLYNVFCRDFKDSVPIFNWQPVFHDTRFIDSDKEEGFWHLVTKDQWNPGSGEKERLPDFARAKRLPWVRSIIENFTCSGVKTWRYVEDNKKVRNYLWLEQKDFMVILQEDTKGYILITAYCVEYQNARIKLQKKYDRRIK